MGPGNPATKTKHQHHNWENQMGDHKMAQRTFVTITLDTADWKAIRDALIFSAGALQILALDERIGEAISDMSEKFVIARRILEAGIEE